VSPPVFKVTFHVLFVLEKPNEGVMYGVMLEMPVRDVPMLHGALYCCFHCCMLLRDAILMLHSAA
jgi:hypothetical protein